MEKYSIFHVEGGLGKNIASTAVAKCIKKNHPNRKLIVVSSYPHVFLNLPYVDRVYKIGITPYFYQDYIEDKDSLVFRNDPYFTTDHIHKTLPLIENWCKLYGLKYSGESPEILFNAREIQTGRINWARRKPIMVIQTNGGPISDQPYKYSWTRDIPHLVSKEIVDSFKEKYHIIQICRDKSQAIEGTECISEPMENMRLMSLLLFSEKRVLIDSCLQHASAALGIPSTVLWVGTSPEVFGYKIHNNFKADIPKGQKLPGSYLFDYSFHGETIECPFLDFNIFNVSSIINSI